MNLGLAGARWRRAIVVLSILALWAIARPGFARAADVPVHSTADLETAVANANPGDVLILDGGIQYQPVSTLVVTEDITIRGPSTAPGAQISGQAVGSSGGSPGPNGPDIMYIAPGARVTLQNLFLTGAQSDFSAVDNAGGTAAAPTTLENVLLATNTLANGLAVQANSFTTVRNTTMNANRVGLSMVDPSATVSLDNVTISSNTGGGIGNVNGGNVSLTNTIVALNTPGGDCATPVTSSHTVSNGPSSCRTGTWGEPGRPQDVREADSESCKSTPS